MYVWTIFSAQPLYGLENRHRELKRIVQTYLLRLKSLYLDNDGVSDGIVACYGESLDEQWCCIVVLPSSVVWSQVKMSGRSSELHSPVQH